MTTDTAQLRRSTTLAEVISLAMEHRLWSTYTALPGEVQAYDAATQTADVLPMLLRPSRDPAGNESVVELPQLTGCPVMFPRAGDYFISLPVVKGTTGLLVFCDGNLALWQKQGGVQDPVETAVHGLNGAVFYPGLWADPDKLSDADADNLVMGKTGGVQIHIDGSCINLGEKSPKKKI